MESVTPIAERRSRVSEANVLAVGRRRFLTGERVDMNAVAGELGIGRATMYRWFGDRDRFTGRVLWSLASDTLDGALARHHQPGATRIVEALVETLETIMADRGFVIWMARDPQKALTILTGRDSLIAGGLRARLQELIERLCPEAAGPGLPAEELAYAMVRLGEAYCYADVIAGRPVEVARTRVLFHRLLEGPCSTA